MRTLPEFFFCATSPAHCALLPAAASFTSAHDVSGVHAYDVERILCFSASMMSRALCRYGIGVDCVDSAVISFALF